MPSVPTNGNNSGYGDSTHADGVDDTQGQYDLATPLPPVVDDDPMGSDDPGRTGGDSDGTSNGEDGFMATPQPQPRVEIINTPPIANDPNTITKLPYRITHTGEYSVSPKAVYKYLLEQNDFPAARTAMIILDLYRDATSEAGASVVMDFNGAVIPECSEKCTEPLLFTTPGNFTQTTRGEHITIKNLTINQSNVDIYNPHYLVRDGNAQYLTLINVNRRGVNTEVMRSQSVRQTTILNSAMSDNGDNLSIDQYQGCITAYNSRYQNKHIQVMVSSSFNSEIKCTYHRLSQTMVSNSLFTDDQDRPFRLYNSYVDNSEFDDIILDMNTSHDFHIGSGNIGPNESVCNEKCGIIDENGKLHWGFAGNEALWLVNKRSE
ncbi:hypothetical protein [Thiolapillus brandeum]|nr:hypothetical protein [Thiolapillus brandeum]